MLLETRAYSSLQFRTSSNLVRVDLEVKASNRQTSKKILAQKAVARCQPSIINLSMIWTWLRVTSTSQMKWLIQWNLVKKAKLWMICSRHWPSLSPNFSKWSARLMMIASCPCAYLLTMICRKHLNAIMLSAQDKNQENSYQENLRPRLLLSLLTFIQNRRQINRSQSLHKQLHSNSKSQLKSPNNLSLLKTFSIY